MAIYTIAQYGPLVANVQKTVITFLCANKDKHIKIVGKVLESVPPKRLVLTWADPSDLADDSRVTFEIDTIEDMVRLNVIHGNFKPGSIMATRIVMGWPRVLSSVKSFLETGAALNT